MIEGEVVRVLFLVGRQLLVLEPETDILGLAGLDESQRGLDAEDVATGALDFEALTFRNGIFDRQVAVDGLLVAAADERDRVH